MESPRIKALSLAKYCRYSQDVISCSSVFRLQRGKRRNQFEGTEAGEGYIENNTWARVDMEILFECLTP